MEINRKPRLAPIPPDPVKWEKPLATLEPQAFSFLRRLSIFAGTFDVERASFVVMGRDVSLLCKTLYKAGFLEALPSVEKGRTHYCVPASLRPLLLERLPLEAAEELHDRYQIAYESLARQAYIPLDCTPDPVWMARLDAEAENLNDVLRLPSTDTLNMSVSLWRWWLYRERYKEGRWHIQRALNNYRDLPGNKAEAYHALAVFAARLGDKDTGEWWLKRAVISAVRDSRRAVLGNALNELGRLYRELGRWEEAVAFHRDSLNVMIQIGNAWGEAAARNGIGLAAWGQDDLRVAHSQLQLSAVLFKRQGDGFQAANVLNNMALVAQARHLHEQAVEGYEASLAMLRPLGKRRGIVGVMQNLGAAYAEMGKTEEAETIILQSLLEMRAIGYFDYMPLAVSHLAQIAWGRQSYERAVLLMASVEGMRQKYPIIWADSVQTEHDAARCALEEWTETTQQFALWQRGSQLDLEGILAYLQA